MTVTTFLMRNRKSEHPCSLKKKYPLQPSVSNFTNMFNIPRLSQHSRKLIEEIVDKGYKKDVAIEQIQKVDQLDRKQWFHQQKCNHKQCMP